MNAFRILSRSTQLSKGRTNAGPGALTPSQGPSSNPQLFAAEANNESRSHDGQPALKKRKRSSQDVDVVPPELDFFSKESSKPVQSLQSQAAVSSTVREQTKDHSPVDRSPPQDVPDLDPEECKKILKSHKLRITTLWAPNNDNGKGKSESFPGKKKSKRKNNDVVDKKRKVEVFPQPLQSFQHLQPKYGVTRRIVDNLEAQGYRTPTEVQLASLPLLVEASESGSSVGIDLLSIAPTGSGKTLAFLVPIINAIIKARKEARSSANHEEGPTAIILAPTKELATQIVNEARKLAHQTGVRATQVKKGMKIFPATDENLDDDPALDNNIPAVKSHILIATPGVLMSSIHGSDGQSASLTSIRYLVLDEADVLLDPLFREQTLAIWTSLKNDNLRVSLWSATMGSSIEDIALQTIKSRLESLSKSAVPAPLLRLVVGLKDTALPTISHKLVYCASESGKLLAMRNLLHPTTTPAAGQPHLRPPFLVFTQTIPRAVALHSELLYDVPASAGGPSRIAVLHADLSDTQRDNVMARFRRGEIWVLITTDLLSRGVDFRGVNGVVNYDFPGSSAAYIHRVGRTGRAGREGGVAVTLYAKDDVPVLGVVANVIAASEKQRQGKAGADHMDGWLLDMLPKVDKRERQKLKKRGVESRSKGAKEARISSKSGYQRKLENRKKHTNPNLQPLQRRKVVSGDDDEDFSGLSD